MNTQDLTPKQAELIARGVIFEYATSPEPVLVFDGHTAVISGIRFYHSDHCASCRRHIEGFSDGGTIRVGIEKTPNGKSYRWYSHYRSGGRPASPAVCKHCGQDPRLGFRRPGMPVPNGEELERKAYEHFWETFPEQAIQARDNADRYNGNHTYDGERWSHSY